ncbi:MAG: hypothetical protein KDD61_14540 [Bdellovibrionales bacterium]|nr:hypothetical protein [Bdellovibrionales bacterium]
MKILAFCLLFILSFSALGREDHPRRLHAVLSKIAVVEQDRKHQLIEANIQIDSKNNKLAELQSKRLRVARLRTHLQLASKTCEKITSKDSADLCIVNLQSLRTFVVSNPEQALSLKIDKALVESKIEAVTHLWQQYMRQKDEAFLRDSMKQARFKAKCRTAPSKANFAIRLAKRERNLGLHSKNIYLTVKAEKKAQKALKTLKELQEACESDFASTIEPLTSELKSHFTDDSQSTKELLSWSCQEADRKIAPQQLPVSFQKACREELITEEFAYSLHRFLEGGSGE